MFEINILYFIIRLLVKGNALASLRLICRFRKKLILNGIKNVSWYNKRGCRGCIWQYRFLFCINKCFPYLHPYRGKGCVPSPPFFVKTKWLIFEIINYFILTCLASSSKIRFCQTLSFWILSNSENSNCLRKWLIFKILKYYY